MTVSGRRVEPGTYALVRFDQVPPSKPHHPLVGSHYHYVQAHLRPDGKCFWNTGMVVSAPIAGALAKVDGVHMNYSSGELVELGDAVYLGGDHNGIVVGLIAEDRYADGYKADDWRFLETGLLLSTDFGDLRMEEPDEDMELMSRAGSLPTQLRVG